MIIFLSERDDYRPRLDGLQAEVGTLREEKNREVSELQTEQVAILNSWIKMGDCLEKHRDYFGQHIIILRERLRRTAVLIGLETLFRSSPTSSAISQPGGPCLPCPRVRRFNQPQDLQY
jgi:hypothetical protein